jgi:hypothetical protein
MEESVELTLASTPESVGVGVGAVGVGLLFAGSDARTISLCAFATPDWEHETAITIRLAVVPVVKDAVTEPAGPMTKGLGA